MAAQRKNEAARHNCVIKIVPRVSSNLVNYRSNFTIQEKGDGSKKTFLGYRGEEENHDYVVRTT